MKKRIITGLALGTLVLSGCGASDEDKIISVGASSVPHAEILEAARPLIEDAGYELDVQVFEDYVLPNKALENGDIDANYFQHVPYLESQIDEFGYDFTPVADIHVEPIQIYSKKYSSIDDIEQGATVLLSNSVSDQSRILALLDENGIITLADGVDTSIATFDDIEENPLDLQFDYDYDPSILSKVFENGEGDLVAINTNYALAAGVDTTEAILSESSESDYANDLVVRSEDVDSEKTQVLEEALTSDEVADFIDEEYDGAVIPAF